MSLRKKFSYTDQGDEKARALCRQIEKKVLQLNKMGFALNATDSGIGIDKIDHNHDMSQFDIQMFYKLPSF